MKFVKVFDIKEYYQKDHLVIACWFKYLANFNFIQYFIRTDRLKEKHRISLFHETIVSEIFSTFLVSIITALVAKTLSSK